MDCKTFKKSFSTIKYTREPNLHDNEDNKRMAQHVGVVYSNFKD